MSIDASISLSSHTITTPETTTVAKTAQEAGGHEQDRSTEAVQDKVTLTSGIDSSEQAQIDELRATDRKVRSHEMAHVASGGAHIRGGVNYTYQRGPDGRMYAVGGKTNVDVSPVPGDPAATAQKMKTVRRAALAPAEPSPQDRTIAAKAAQVEAQAQMEIAYADISGKEATYSYTVNSKGELPAKPAEPSEGSLKPASGSESEIPAGTLVDVIV